MVGGGVKIAMGKEKKLITGGLNVSIIKILLENYVWSMAMYASETWILECRDVSYPGIF